MSELTSKLRAMAASKERYLPAVDKWLTYWMNQRQNSQADFENYFRRAFGVDANMRHHLADLLAKEEAPLLERLIECVEALSVANDALGTRSKLMRHLDHDFLVGSKASEMQADAHEVVKQGWRAYECVTMLALQRLEQLVEGAEE